MAAPDLNRLDFSTLLAALNTLQDPRRRRGIRHRLPQILAVAVIAALRGATSLLAMGQVAAELETEALTRLGCRVSPSTGLREAPEESTIRRTLRAINADALDKIVNTWLAAQVAVGHLKADRVPEIDLAAIVEEDESVQQADDDSDDTRSGPPGAPVLLPAVALDGKTLRGARIAGGRQVHLVSVLTHNEGVTIAQCNVDTKTNEITAFRPLLDPLNLAGCVVTADPLHTQRAHARFLVDEKQAHYVFGLKDNQPTLAALAERLLANCPVAYESHDRGHGRIEHRYVSVVAIDPTLRPRPRFPHVAQFVAVRRERADLSGRITSTETSLYVTDLNEHEADPEQLACYIRGHWGIENRSHYVRDRTFDEDRCQVRKGAAPQALATVRNLAISILRLAGFQNIASALRWMAWDYRRSFQLLGL